MDLRVEVVEAEVMVVSEDRDWLNLYSLELLPSRVRCLTILLRRLPWVEMVPS